MATTITGMRPPVCNSVGKEHHECIQASGKQLALLFVALYTIAVGGGGIKSNVSGIFGTVLAVLLMGFVAWGYQAIQPPASKICGSPNGSTITAPRIKLRDGRNLSYKEHGVPKDVAKHKIIFVHDVAEKLGVYIVSFDRPGYGESDPDPIQTLKSLTLDIEELADKLGLGPNST
ncbi:Protein NRT1/ PTR FAMILY 6.4 [Glycine max]|nr:Protein NRT1/ PTR FAMILY 6.4 [Glycine max]